MFLSECWRQFSSVVKCSLESLCQGRALNPKLCFLHSSKKILVWTLTMAQMITLKRREKKRNDKDTIVKRKRKPQWLFCCLFPNSFSLVSSEVFCLIQPFWTYLLPTHSLFSSPEWSVYIFLFLDFFSYYFNMNNVTKKMNMCD